MGAEDFIKDKADIIMWITHIGIALWILGDGVVLSQEVGKIIIYAIIGLSIYIYNKTKKALDSERTKTEQLEKDIETIKTAKKETPKEGSKPFDFEVGK